jgi:hypothetical protein
MFSQSPQNGLLNTISNIMKSGNPQQIAQDMLRQNPQLAQQIGGDPKAFAMNLMRQRGIDPAQIQTLMNGLNKR